MKKILLPLAILICITSVVTNIFLAKSLWWKTVPTEVRNFSIDEPIVMRHRGGLLEVSTITNVEVFEATKEHQILGVNVGKTVSRIRVPAYYRFQVDLDSQWKIFVRDKKFVAIAPRPK